MILVANKVDLSHRRVVSLDQGISMARSFGIIYMETSAKDPPQNIDEAFKEVIVITVDLYVQAQFAASPELNTSIESVLSSGFHTLELHV